MRSGFSLVELAVALVLFGVMGLGAVELVYQAHRAARVADTEERLLWRATALADSVEAGDIHGAGERLIPGLARLRWASGADGFVEIIPWNADTARARLPVATDAGLPSLAGSGPVGR